VTHKEQAKIISTKTEFNGWHKLDVVTLQHYSLEDQSLMPAISRDVFYCPAAAVALLYVAETDQILLNQQFRTGVFMAGDPEPYVYELCSGVIDKGETPEEAIIREAEEETGSKILDLEFAGKSYTNPSSSTHFFHMFCGRIKAPVTGIYGEKSEGEEVKTHLVDADEVIKMAQEGKIGFMGAVACIYWFAANKDRLRKKWSD